MSELKKTHREVKEPQITSRYLADYMAASEIARRSIVRKCKYQAISPVVQHREAKLSIAKFLRNGSKDFDELNASSFGLRERMADSDFDRDVLDHNADYIDHFLKVQHKIQLPDADRLPQGQTPPVEFAGVKVNVEVHCRFRRLTKTNKVRVGAAALRYRKGKALAEPVAEWQGAFLFGYLNMTGQEDEAQPEHKLCLVIDAWAGIAYSAPTDSVSRFNNMKAACATIAEQWPEIKPPPGAVL